MGSGIVFGFVASDPSTCHESPEKNSDVGSHRLSAQAHLESPYDMYQYLVQATGSGSSAKAPY